MKLLKSLPTSAVALLLVMGLLMPVLFLLFRGTEMAPLVAGLYIALAVIAGLGVLFFERGKKSKAKGFAEEVASNAASAEGIKDPNKIAQMDHMRKEFQRGIDIYKKHGKDLYSLPWYVVVGESESGKTEMLRRSEIGFPDKLQDRWQGSGGTLSMHWWFTSKAVILDTAGRLFVSEGAEGGQNQWVSFLQMLKKNRPDCPINGLILVIPSNRLLTHPNPDIESIRGAELDRNAGQIAKQMESLQAELGVRFPVYILITKMDKLNGFREFFGKLDKPEDRYQILGWSNPAPLGSAFEPQSVAEYMRSVADRLSRRMMSELRGVEPENPAGLRIDEVDSLYAFPTAFESMTDKLTRYLRHIFTTDEWSAKPPFLRGIYFTSALQQGRVLDEALAAAMGVPLERMDSTQEDDGLSLAKNRTYFVRDLFLDKIFSEKGLVTTAGKIKSSISGWRLWMPAAIILMLVVFGALGLMADNSCPEVGHWKSIWDSGEAGARIRPLVTWDEQDRVLQPDVGDPERNAAKTLSTLSALGGVVGAPPKFRWIFAPARWFDKNLSQGRPELYSKLVAESLAGLEDTLIRRYDSDTDRKARWTAEDWQAIHAIIILRTRGAADWKRDSGKTGLGTEALLRALFETAKLDPALASPMGDSINHAHHLPAGNFAAALDDERKRLAALCKRDTKDLLQRLLPNTELKSQELRHEALNQLVKGISKAESPSELSLPSALALPPGSPSGNAGSSLPPKDPSFDPSKELANTPAKLADVIRAYASKFDYESKPVELSPAAKALSENRDLLDQVTLTVDILAGKAPLREGQNMDIFKREPKKILEAAKADDKSEATGTLEKLADLKQIWFDKTFIPEHLPGFLCQPIVSNADKPGTEANLFALWRILELGKFMAVKSDKLDRLHSSFNLFFDTDKLAKGDGIAASRRTWNASDITKIQKDPTGQKNLFIFVIRSEGLENEAKWDHVEGNAKPEQEIYPGGRTEFAAFQTTPKPGWGRNDAAAYQTMGPWEILDGITEDRTDGTWTSKTKAGHVYGISIKDTRMSKLASRPKKEEF